VRFNPRPAGWPGAADRYIQEAVELIVSILARLVGRALRRSAVINGWPKEFQSSPGWLAGRCKNIFIYQLWRLSVSILARLVGRALPNVLR